MRIFCPQAKLVVGLIPILLSITAHAQINPQGSVGKIDKVAYGTFGFDETGMDRSVAPGDDFIRYANGTYLKNLVIPEDQSNFGMFLKLRDLSKQRTRIIVETAAVQRNTQPGSETQKVGDFYASFMDEAAIEAKGLAPVQALLEGTA